MERRMEQKHGIVLPLLVSFLLILSMGVSACQNAGDLSAEPSGIPTEDALPADALQADTSPEADAEIASVIQGRLESHPDVDPLTIDVDSINGRVTLNGTARSHSEKTEAEKIARSTDGVRSITNLIQVVGLTPLAP